MRFGARTKRQNLTVDIAAIVVQEARSGLAVLIDDGIVKVWVPKSQIVINANYTITMPEWLAKEKGII